MIILAVSSKLWAPQYFNIFIISQLRYNCNELFSQNLHNNKQTSREAPSPRRTKTSGYGRPEVHGKRPVFLCRHERAKQTGIMLSR